MTGSRLTRRSSELRASLYLMRLDWHLEAVVSGSERRRILRSLREEIDQDPRPVEEALADLGSPRTLAARYGEGGRQRPLWSIGVVTAGTALFGYWVVFLTFAGGMLAVVDAASPMSAQAHFLFVPVMAFSNADGIGIGWSGGVEWLVVPAAMAVTAFLVGARVWRLLARTEVSA